MRLSHLLLAALLALAGPARAADNTLERVLELSGVKLLCEQTAPLLQRGMQAEQQKALGQAFAAAPLCRDLASRVAKQVKREQLDAALKLLDSPLARLDLEHRENVLPQIVETIWPRRDGAATMASRVVADQSMVFGKCSYLWVPHL